MRLNSLSTILETVSRVHDNLWGSFEYDVFSENVPKKLPNGNLKFVFDLPKGYNPNDICVSFKQGTIYIKGKAYNTVWRDNNCLTGRCYSTFSQAYYVGEDLYLVKYKCDGKVVSAVFQPAIKSNRVSWCKGKFNELKKISSEKQSYNRSVTSFGRFARLNTINYTRKKYRR